MKSLYLLFFGIILSSSLIAQSDSKDKRSTEIGLNITNTLAGFFNAGGSDLPTDPYLLSFKRSNKDGALRFGLNFKVKNKREFLDNGTRNIKENDVFFRAGYEWRKKVDKRFTLFYGLDLVGEFENEQLSFQSFGFEDLSSFDNIYGFGGGPFLGIMFRLNDRIALSTEGSIYGLLQYNENLTDIGNGLPPVESNSTGFKMSPAVPSSLYAIFIF